jgi:Ca2+-binding EF-hand superfamily protein
MSEAEVYRERFERLFNAYDCDRDGFLTRENFLDHAHKLAAIRGVAADSPALGQLVAFLEEWWGQLSDAADDNGDGRVSRDEFQAWAARVAVAMKQAMSGGSAWPFNDYVARLYDMIDADGDGKITLKEYEEWCTALGIAGEMDVEGAFLGFDKNLDGFLSREEFTKVSQQFWLNPNPNVPGHRWVGP